MPQRSQKVGFTHTEATVKIDTRRPLRLFLLAEQLLEALGGCGIRVDGFCELLQTFHRGRLARLGWVGDVGVEGDLPEPIRRMHSV